MSANCCLRSLLTLLHGLIGLGTGFFCLYSLIGWSFDTTCLPKMIDASGNLLIFKNGLPVICDGLVYGMAVVCVINFAMCLIINWLWPNVCVAFINLLLTVIYISFAVMGGTTIAIYYIVWCDTLERRFPDSHGCQDAAERYDSYNATGEMSLYKTRMEVQMVSIWAVFPVIGFTIISYALIMRIFAKPDARDGRLRYVILDEEATPLLNPDNTEVNENIYSNDNIASRRSVSNNPFDN
ncbi:unnamed protein product [Candidula unifasciata]|uniref:Uncharacterized protein n=1 Tax=Candidula unifasciata TaxID=100452 RepID=A0A8S3Z2J7_9EUPU|nr:unnamed protein product [Candidula unifasciata]